MHSIEELVKTVFPEAKKVHSADNDFAFFSVGANLFVLFYIVDKKIVVKKKIPFKTETSLHNNRIDILSIDRVCAKISDILIGVSREAINFLHNLKEDLGEDKKVFFSGYTLNGVGFCYEVTVLLDSDLSGINEVLLAIKE